MSHHQVQQIRRARRAPGVRAPLRAIGLAVTLITAVVPFESRADAPTERPSVVVRFAELDLQRAEGAATLYARLQHAARFVCDDATLVDGEARRAVRRCVRGALDDAVERIDRPLLTRLHGIHYGFAR